MKTYTWAVNIEGYRLKDYWLMDEAIKAVKKDFFWFHCHWGLKGVEKSNSLLGFAYDLLSLLHPTWEPLKIWTWVKKLIVFDVPTYDATVEEAKNSEIAYKTDDGFPRVPIILWDDMGMYFSKRKKLTKDRQIFLDEFDAVREDVAILEATMPKPDKPHKGLRDEYTHEIHWKEAGWGLVEYYDQGISKKAGESKVFKRLIHGIRSRWIPQEHFLDYRIMKREAKARLTYYRQMNFTQYDINRLIQDDLSFDRDKDILNFCFEAARRKRSAAPTEDIYTLYRQRFKQDPPYGGYVTDILRRLHGLGLIIYTVRGRHGEVKISQKGLRVIETLAIKEKPPELSKNQ